MRLRRRIGTLVGALVPACAAALSAQWPAERLESRLGAWLAERLAIDVLCDISGWTADWIRAAAMLPAEWRVVAPDSIPTYLAYWTAWVDGDGTVEFRPDLYGWDAELAAALGRRERAVP